MLLVSVTSGIPSLPVLEQMPVCFGFDHTLSRVCCAFSVNVRDTHCDWGDGKTFCVGKAGVWLRSLSSSALRNRASREWARCQGFGDVSKTYGLYRYKDIVC